MLRKQVLVAAFISLALLSGCKKKAKTKLLPPSVTLPAPTTTETITAEIPLEPSLVPLPSKPPAAAKTKPKPRPRKPSAATVQPPAGSETTPADGTQAAVNTPPPRITISAGGSEPSGGISAAISHTDEAHHKLTATQLIDSTEDNLRSIKRALTNNEQNLVRQINNFLNQAKDAIKSNDMVRAHNLALKGHLLSDELARRQ